MSIVGGGTVQLKLQDADGEPFELILSDVAYALKLRCNLTSISKFAQAGVHGSWNSLREVMQLRSQEGCIIGKANLNGGLYHLQLASAVSNGKKPQHHCTGANRTRTYYDLNITQQRGCPETIPRNP